MLGALPHCPMSDQTSRDAYERHGLEDGMFEQPTTAPDYRLGAAPNCIANGIRPRAVASHAPQRRARPWHAGRAFKPQAAGSIPAGRTFAFAS